MSLKIDRLNNIIMREISAILMTEVKDPNVKFVTITSVRTTNDLSFTKVYFTSLKDEFRKETIKALRNASGFIRKELANRIEIRHVPKIEFIYDESIEYGRRIEDKINEIHEREK